MALPVMQSMNPISEREWGFFFLIGATGFSWRLCVGLSRLPGIASCLAVFCFASNEVVICCQPVVFLI